jgi:hypothetical protein
MQHFHRGERRYQRRRLIAKYYRREARYFGDGSSWWGGQIARDECLYNYVRVLVNTRTLCSCSTCGNGRRHYGNARSVLTRQELHALARMNDEE